MDFLYQANKEKIEDSFNDPSEHVEEIFYLKRGINRHNLSTVSNEEFIDKDIRRYKPNDDINDIKKVSTFESHYLNNFDYVLEKGLSLIFFGDNGTGKTIEGMRILYTILSMKYTGYYITFRNYANLYNEVNFGSSDYYQNKLLSHIKNCDFLIVDEVGKESSVTENLVAMFEEFLKERSDKLKPTLLVTNYNLRKTNKFKETYGDSVFDILKKRYRFFEFSKKSKLRERTKADWEGIYE